MGGSVSFVVSVCFRSHPAQGQHSWKVLGIFLIADHGVLQPSTVNTPEKLRQAETVENGQSDFCSACPIDLQDLISTLPRDVRAHQHPTHPSLSPTNIPQPKYIKITTNIPEFIPQGVVCSCDRRRRCLWPPIPPKQGLPKRDAVCGRFHVPSDPLTPSHPKLAPGSTEQATAAGGAHHWQDGPRPVDHRPVLVSGVVFRGRSVRLWKELLEDTAPMDSTWTTGWITSRGDSVAMESGPHPSGGWLRG